MKYTSIIPFTLVAVWVLVLAWCSNSSSSIPSENTTQTISEDQSNKNSESVDSTLPPTDNNTMSHSQVRINTEEEFILHMIPHHQEAIDTATIIIQKSQYKKLQALAQAIVDAQTKEVTMMNWWMQSRYPSSTKQVEYMKMMDANLWNLEGNELDKLFILGMIKHHQWAIMMAQQVLEISQKPEIVKMANDIITSQTSEIKELNHLLEDVGQPEHSD